MRNVGEATEPRKTRSLPMAVTFISISARLPAMVTSSTAWVSCAVLNPQAGRAARVVAGDDVDAEAHQAGDVEARRNLADDLLRRQRSRLEIQIAAADARRARQPARGVVRGLHAQLARQ